MLAQAEFRNAIKEAKEESQRILEYQLQNGTTINRGQQPTKDK